MAMSFRMQEHHVRREETSLSLGLVPPGAIGRPSSFSSRDTLSGRTSLRSTNSFALVFCTTLPGIGGIADASTEGGLAGGDNRDKSPDDAMGVVAKVIIADDAMDVAGAQVKVNT